MDYAVMISYIDPDDNKTPVSLILDTVEDTAIDATSTVTQHPTVHGTPMADHMYKNPISLRLNGMFSLNGKEGIVIKNGHGSLARVEQMFERIKNDGILCVIVKVKMDDNNTPQFSYRENMVLSSIHWDEQINSLGFSFGFEEALRADVQTYQVDPDDRFAPAIEYAESASFSDTLLDWNKVDEEVLQALLDYDLMDDKFCNYLNTLGVAGMAALTTVSIAVLASALVSLGVISAIPGGVIVAAVIAVAAFFVLGIAALIKTIKRSAYKVKAFTYYKKKKKADEEVERFINFYEYVHDKIRSLDGVIKCWNITENKAQETIISIGGAYYIFNFEKNNLQGNAYDELRDDLQQLAQTATGKSEEQLRAESTYAYKLTISDIEDRVLKETNTNIALSAYTDGTPENALFSANGWYVYLIRPTQLEDAKNDLTKYLVCASQMNPQDFGKALTKIIQETIKY